MNVRRSGGRLLWLLLLVGVYAAPAAGGVVVDRTRVIYPVAQGEVTVGLQNDGEDGDGPFLVQAWVDEGTTEVSAETSQAPFVILPPVQRIDAGARGSLRIRGLPARLPTDRETVFWLHVLAIPGMPPAGAAQDDVLQLAVATRLKLFWRPGDLDGRADAAPGKLRWKYRPSADEKCMVQVENPTPYHVTLVELTLSAGRADDAVGGSGLMLAPFSSQQIAVGCASPAAMQRPRLTFSTVDDVGTVQVHVAESTE